ncbi:hypothetical protein B566_EDAN015821 [Ephemera danica]|nr:hypothetical protein B566_EDAN015821 [Ephemera danica]
MGQAEGVVDLLALLARIRSQRTNMVDNKNQYETAHRVLLELNTLPGSELPVQNFHAAIRSIQELGILGQQFWELNEVCKRDMPESYDLSWPQEKNRFPDIVPAGEMAPHHPELLIRVWNEMQTVPETVVLACHDGATASGLMVSAALMLEHLQATRRIDVVSAVRRARRTRPQFVCSLAQFEFLHSVMLAQVESMDTYVNI